MRNRFFSFPFLCLFCGLAAALASCRAPDESRWPRLTMLVASEAGPLREVVNAALVEYKNRMGTIVTVETTSSTRVLDRLAQPAPPDVVLVSDPALVRVMVQRRLIDSSQWLLERMCEKLALVARPDSALTLNRLDDLLRPTIRAIGLTRRPETTNRLALQILRDADLGRRLSGKIQTFDTPEQLIDQVVAGQVQLGMIRNSSLPRLGGQVKPLLVVEPDRGSFPAYLALAVNRNSSRAAAAHQLWGHLEGFLRDAGPVYVPASSAGGMIELPE